MITVSAFAKEFTQRCRVLELECDMTRRGETGRLGSPGAARVTSAMSVNPRAIS
jgi:hypothetical protein